MNYNQRKLNKETKRLIKAEKFLYGCQKSSFISMRKFIKQNKLITISSNDLMEQQHKTWVQIQLYSQRIKEVLKEE